MSVKRRRDKDKGVSEEEQKFQQSKIQAFKMVF